MPTQALWPARPRSRRRPRSEAIARPEEAWCGRRFSLIRQGTPSRGSPRQPDHVFAGTRARGRRQPQPETPPALDTGGRRSRELRKGSGAFDDRARVKTGQGGPKCRMVKPATWSITVLRRYGPKISSVDLPQMHRLIATVTLSRIAPGRDERPDTAAGRGTPKDPSKATEVAGDLPVRDRVRIHGQRWQSAARPRRRLDDDAGP